MELPGSVEEIEKGVTAKQQKARDRYGADLLLPIDGALVAVPVPQDAPGCDAARTKVVPRPQTAGKMRSERR